MNEPLDLSSLDCHVFAVRLQESGTAETLNTITAEDKNVWLHLDYSAPDCTATLQTLGIKDTVIESLIRSDTRPRALAVGEGMLILLRAINMNPGNTPDDMVSLRCWVEKDRLITIRQRRVMSVQEIQDELMAGKGPQSIRALFHGIIERIAERISTYVEHLETQLDEHESALEVSEAVETHKKIAQLRREAAVVRRYLAPQRDALESFYRLSNASLDDSERHFLHEQTDRIMRYVEDLDLMREQAMVLQEELMNRIAQEQNARMYVLSIIAAIFLPISFVTGLFGMNVGGLPGIESEQGFNWVAGFMIVCVIGIVAYFRHRKWL